MVEQIDYWKTTTIHVVNLFKAWNDDTFLQNHSIILPLDSALKANITVAGSFTIFHHVFFIPFYCFIWTL